MRLRSRSHTKPPYLARHARLVDLTDSAYLRQRLLVTFTFSFSPPVFSASEKTRAFPGLSLHPIQSEILSLSSPIRRHSWTVVQPGSRSTHGKGLAAALVHRFHCSCWVCHSHSRSRSCSCHPDPLLIPSHHPLGCLYVQSTLAVRLCFWNGTANCTLHTAAFLLAAHHTHAAPTARPPAYRSSQSSNCSVPSPGS